MEISQPKTSELTVVIVSAMQRLDDLNRCLKSLTDQNSTHSYEVCVVIHEEKDFDIQEWIHRGLYIRVLKSRNHNYCAKRNVGLRGAKGRIIAFIDDDVLLPSGWVTAVIEGFSQEWRMAGGPVEPVFESKVPGNLKNVEKHIGGFNNNPRTGYATETIIGCNMFFNRAWLMQSGGFDEFIGEMNMAKPRMFYGGDEVDVKTRLACGETGFIPGAGLKHHIQTERISQEYIYTRAELMGRTKNYIDHKNNNIKRFHLFDKYYYLFLSLIKVKNRIRFKKKYYYVTGYLSKGPAYPS